MMGGQCKTESRPPGCTWDHHPQQASPARAGSCRHQHRQLWEGSQGYVRTGVPGDVTKQISRGAGSKGQHRKPESSVQGWQSMPGELGTPGRLLENFHAH